MVNLPPIRRKRRGANAIEFAITLPVFLIVISGIMDFSWFAYQRSILKTAAMEGCRAASLVDPGEEDIAISGVIQTGSKTMLERLTALGGEELCANRCNTKVNFIGTAPGRSLQCTIGGEYHPLWGMVVGSINISSTSITLMEWQRWTG